MRLLVSCDLTMVNRYIYYLVMCFEKRGKLSEALKECRERENGRYDRHIMIPWPFKKKSIVIRLSQT